MPNSQYDLSFLAERNTGNLSNMVQSFQIVQIRCCNFSLSMLHSNQREHCFGHLINSAYIYSMPHSLVLFVESDRFKSTNIFSFESAKLTSNFLSIYYSRLIQPTQIMLATVQCQYATCCLPYAICISPDNMLIHRALFQFHPQLNEEIVSSSVVRRIGNNKARPMQPKYFTSQLFA